MAVSRTENPTGQAWRTAGVIALLLAASVVVAAFVVSQVVDGGAELAFGSEPTFLSTGNTPEGARRLAGELPGSLVEDERGTVWAVESADVEIFHDSYLSPDGTQVTVQSADGDKVVAPGTGGVYDFTARNTVDAPLTYSLSVDTIVSMQAASLPVEGRVRSADGWLSGGDDEWVPLSEMGVIDDSAKLGAYQSRGYRFEWRWPFERDGSGGDTLDTQAGGGDGASQPLDVSVRLNATASYDGDFSQRVGAGASGASGAPQTGDPLRAAPFAAAAVAASLLAAVAMLMLLARRDRRLVRSGASDTAAPDDGAAGVRGGGRRG